MKNLSTKNIVLISTVLAITIFVGAFFVSKNQIANQSLQVAPTDNINTVKKVEEEIKDGVYTNYTYGFKLKYPEELVSKAKQYRNELHIYDKENKYIADRIGPEFAENNTGLLEFIEKIEALELKETLYNPSQMKLSPKNEWPISNFMKLSSLKKSDFNCATYYAYPTGGGEGSEPNWSYNLYCKSGGKLIGFSLSTIMGENALLEYKTVFDQIVQSFTVLR